MMKTSLWENCFQARSDSGNAIREHLARENIGHEELLQALRTHGVAAVEDVRLAVLELDGSISVIKNQDLGSDMPSRPYHRIKSLRRRM